MVRHRHTSLAVITISLQNVSLALVPSGAPFAAAYEKKKKKKAYHGVHKASTEAKLHLCARSHTDG